MTCQSLSDREFITPAKNLEIRRKKYKFKVFVTRFTSVLQAFHHRSSHKNKKALSPFYHKKYF